MATPTITDLGNILSHRVFPLLAGPDLAAMACISRELKHHVDNCPPHVWEAVARQLLPKAHPLQQPATQASIRAALQAYSYARNNLGAENCAHKRRSASEASFSPSGSHLATVCKDSVDILDAKTLELVTSYKGLGVGVASVQWGKQGTMGALTVRTNSRTRPVFYHGDLVQGSDREQPLSSLTCTHLQTPAEVPQANWTPVLSPDLARVFVSRLENTAGDSPDKCRAVSAIYDLSTGNEVWEECLEGRTQKDLHELLTVGGATWLSDNDTVIYVVSARAAHIAWDLRTIKLSDGSSRHFDLAAFGFAAPQDTFSWEVADIVNPPEGQWVLIHFQHVKPNERDASALLHWPSGKVHSSFRDETGNLPVWNWEGSKLASTRQLQGIHNISSLCVMTLPAISSPADMSQAPALWSYRFDKILEWGLDADAHAGTVLSFSPDGKILALALQPGYAKHAMIGCDMSKHGTILFADTTSAFADSAIIAQIDLECGLVAQRLEWSPDSAKLCAVGHAFRTGTGSRAPVEARSRSVAYVLDFGAELADCK